jgi:hypothetical protein
MQIKQQVNYLLIAAEIPVGLDLQALPQGSPLLFVKVQHAK